MTALAIGLAVAAALTFGLAAVSQHRAVRTTLAPAAGDQSPVRRRLALRHLGTLLSDRGWLRGFALMTLGTVCHVLALSLAPISLTQPINVLAVPTTIVATAMASRRRPPGSVVVAALAVVLGVAAFVLAVSDAPAGVTPDPELLAVVAATLVVTTVLLHLIARRLTGGDHHAGPQWLAPVLVSVAGAANFGAASSTFRLLALHLFHGAPLSTAVTVGLICFVPVGLTAGAWSIQQAYAAGAAPAVTATSTLTDPIVALTIGMAVLAETPELTPLRLLIMIIATTVAAAGVIHLARHDEDVDRPPEGAVAGHDHAHDHPAAHQTRNRHAHPARR